MKRANVIYFIIALLLLSCGNKKDSDKKVSQPLDIVSPEQMKEVLVDVLYTEGAVGVTEMKYRNAKYLTLHYYNYVFKKHNMTSQQFMANYNYYAGDITQMDKIMNDVIIELSEKQGITKAKSKPKEEE